MNVRLELYADDKARWQAFSRREPAADGMFVVAVRTTGIYCRPTCPARRPRRENVTFYPDGAAAEAAGYRPCRRCRPDRPSPQQLLVAQTLELLNRDDPPPSVAAVARHLGVDRFQLQRVFRKATGLTPQAYLAELRAERLRQGLAQGLEVTEALYAAGYGSSRAVYERAAERLGMTPGAYRRGGAGRRVVYGVFPSPLGPLLVAGTDQGLCAAAFEPGDAGAALARSYPHAELVEDPAAVAAWADAINAYLRGDSLRLDLPLDLEGTAFQRRVWAELCGIPRGQTITYGQLAQAIGRPEAARAVARACASNPVALVIPCHRVIAAGGGLRGYRWGLERKKALLQLEGAMV